MHYKMLSKVPFIQNLSISLMKTDWPTSRVTFYNESFLKNNIDNLSLIGTNESRYNYCSGLPWNFKYAKGKLNKTFTKQLQPITITCLENKIELSSTGTGNTRIVKMQGFKTSAKSTESQHSVCEVLELYKERLKKEEIDEAELHAEYIVAQALEIRRINLNAILRNSVSVEKIADIEKMMACRLARMPLQYIMGEWDFHSIKLKLRPPVFIPRQETEGLVNIAIDLLRDADQPLVLDIGCGSGAISLSLLNHFPQLQCVALDQSRYAIELTSDNANALNLGGRLTLVEGKVSEEGVPAALLGLSSSSRFDGLVSNPPYVPRKDLARLQPEITLYEDLRALDGGREGLDVIARVLLHGQHLLKDEGWILIEIDPCHRYLLPSWMKENKTSLEIHKFYKDYNGVTRYVKLMKREIKVT